MKARYSETSEKSALARVMSCAYLIFISPDSGIFGSKVPVLPSFCL